jgi:hypothetical protein
MLTLINGTKCMTTEGFAREDDGPWITMAIRTEQFAHGWRRLWLYDSHPPENGPFVSVTWQHDTEPTNADSFLMFLASRLPWAGEPLPA